MIWFIFFFFCLHKSSSTLGNITSSCNAKCNCDVKYFSPVCSKEDQLTFYSPCFAGCSADNVIGTKVRNWISLTCLFVPLFLKKIINFRIEELIHSLVTTETLNLFLQWKQVYYSLRDTGVSISTNNWQTTSAASLLREVDCFFLKLEGGSYWI